MMGTYILAIQVLRAKTIRIGALGNLKFKKGYYFYVGSGMASKGSTSLLNRVKRHLRSENNKSIRWHIDYLLCSNVSQIIKIYLLPSNKRYECLIAKTIAHSSYKMIKDFGSSDCKCHSHLFYFKEKVKIDIFLKE